MKSEISVPEETLDPDDWQGLRALAHRMLDDMLANLQTIGDQPVWRHAPQEIKDHFDKPLPLDPQAPEEIYEEFRQYVLPYPVGNIHPRFWGWVIGTGTAFGALAELLAAFMNTNTGGIDHHSANYVEKQVISWIRSLFGFSDTASGLLTSGCSAANLIGLAVARNSKADADIRRRGMAAAGPTVVYASKEIHSSIQKALELLGMGSDALHPVPVNDHFQIDCSALRAMIDLDRRQGSTPICVVGAAGTTNTGAVDDLSTLADICREQDLWFHVDGAFGAWAILAEDAKIQVAGIERADSLALDLHKWMYLPYEIGCCLVREESHHRRTFSLTPDYLAHGEGGRGMTGGDLPWFSDYGFQLSRGFRALKAWMSFKEQGLNKYGRLIQQNIDQARYLGSLVETSERLELTAPVTLNVVCFRYIRPGLSEEDLDQLNKWIVAELQEEGLAVPSGTLVRGRYVLHVAITNHRSRRSDFDLLVRETLRLGAERTEPGKAP